MEKEQKKWNSTLRGGYEWDGLLPSGRANEECSQIGQVRIKFVFFSLFDPENRCNHV